MDDKYLNKDKIRGVFRVGLENILTPLLDNKGIVSVSALVNTIMTIICVNFDLFGYLYSGGIGKSSSANATQFIRRYMGRIDERYSRVGGLLYNNLRHGWVHQFGSKRFVLSSGEKIYFGFGHSRRYGKPQHLALIEGNREGKVLKIFFIHLQVLCEDFLSAIDLYAEDLEKNKKLKEKFERAYGSVMDFEKEQELIKRKYITEEDFKYIYSLL